MSFNDDMKHRGQFTEDEHYMVSWIITSGNGDFGTLRVYLVGAPTKPILIQSEVLRASNHGSTLMGRALWYLNDRKMKKDALDAKEDYGHETMGDKVQRLADPAYTPDNADRVAHPDGPLPWEEAWEDVRITREWALYWFTGYYSTSGAIVYESKELALHAEKMLKKHIAGVIVVLTPMEGKVPDDGDQE